MPLPSSGPISMSQVAAELGISATGLSLNDSRVRALAGRASGPISFSDLRGKSASFKATLTVGSAVLNGVTYYGFESSPASFGGLSNTSLGGSQIISFSSYTRRRSTYAQLYIRNPRPYTAMQIKVGNIVANLASSDVTSSGAVIVRIGSPANKQIYDLFAANVGRGLAVEISGWTQ